MKKIYEIKNEVAQEHGYASYLDVFEFTYALCDEVAKRYAIEAIKADRERIKQHHVKDLHPYAFGNLAIVLGKDIDNLPIELK